MCHSDFKHLHQRLLPAIYQFVWLSDEESVNVSPVMTVHTLRKKGEIKTVPFLTRLPSSLVFWRTLNWLNGCDRENIFGEVCWDGYVQK